MSARRYAVALRVARTTQQDAKNMREIAMGLMRRRFDANVVHATMVRLTVDAALEACAAAQDANAATAVAS